MKFSARFIVTKQNEDPCVKIRTKENVRGQNDNHTIVTAEIRMLSITNPLLSSILINRSNDKVVLRDGDDTSSSDVEDFKQFVRQAGLSLDKKFQNNDQTMNQSLVKLQTQPRSAITAQRIANDIMEAEPAIQEWKEIRNEPIIKIE